VSGYPGGCGEPPSTFAVGAVGRLAASLGVELDLEPPPDVCPVLDFAASGAMWLTGFPDGPPVAPDGPLVAHLRVLGRAILELSDHRGSPVRVDVGRELTERAALRGFARSGSTSANGTCRMVRAADGWVAVNLPRVSDWELLPTITGTSVTAGWDDVRRSLAALASRDIVQRAQLVGLPIAALPTRARLPSAGVPIRSPRIGKPGAPETAAPLVVDFSAMWAGPLCAHVLGAAGCRVVKVEDPERPDGARVGDAPLYDRLHRGHELLSVSFASAEGRERLRSLVSDADVVVEASRPRALGHLGFSPEGFLQAREGRTWISITGYGRRGPRANHVAFGDDAAAAGGLVGWCAAPPSGTGVPGEPVPVFCADAVADPLSGLYAAFGGLGSMASGGGHLVDVSMSAAAAFVQSGPPCPGAHVLERDGKDGWVVGHDGSRVSVAPPAATASP
jgi:CoA-transferase family III